MRSFRFALVFLVACSSPPAIGSDASAPDSGDSAAPMDAMTVAPTTWMDGTVLDSSVLIPEGTTVTIAPGAQITASAGVSITVEGKLVASSAATHAKISGTGWIGLIAQNAGTLALDGVDLSGAQKAIDDRSSAPATYDNGTITSGVPFTIAKGSDLSTSHSTVLKPTDMSVVQGSFTASYLDYDSNGHHAIMAADPSAKVFIEDSKFHGGPEDLLNGYGASLFHVAYTDITGAHCGFHFTAVDTLEIDHVTVHGVVNGADLWGSSASGKHAITNSNFLMLSESFDEMGSNGPIQVSGCYLSGTNNLGMPSAVTISNAAAQPVANAGPR